RTAAPAAPADRAAPAPLRSPSPKREWRAADEPLLSARSLSGGGDALRGSGGGTAVRGCERERVRGLGVARRPAVATGERDRGRHAGVDVGDARRGARGEGELGRLAEVEGVRAHDD